MSHYRCQAKDTALTAHVHIIRWNIHLIRDINLEVSVMNQEMGYLIFDLLD